MKNFILNKNTFSILATFFVIVYAGQFINSAGAQTHKRFENKHTQLASVEVERVKTDFSSLIEISEVSMTVEDDGDVLVIKEIIAKAPTSESNKSVSLDKGVENNDKNVAL